MDTLRIVVAKPGLDGHDRGAKVVARALRDAGHEVIYTGLRRTPEEIIRIVEDEDASILGLSSLSGAHGFLFPRVCELLKENGLDDVVVTQEFHLPVDRKVIFKFRSQDVLHSAYMPHFRAQMNCVPGMVTEFSFTPTVTTADMRMNPDVVSKVERINKIRYDNSQELIAKGEMALEPYQFDYLLLCAKICGSSHYNMQMKIIVESEKDFNKWLSSQSTFSETIQ